ncbi:DUF6090 family protein [Balneola sp. MJW-20]|uniref:DUF6090 family protein n=1 Tax=Gracilimonas aurantiaca TaxID=3234185 RepID=UPI003467A8F0
MITLFRRIREKLIASGSVTKYLLYAAGEILLVVIGILIALQINNWNEQRIEDKLSEEYLAGIREDLGKDLDQVNRLIQQESEVISLVNSIDEVFNKMMADEPAGKFDEVFQTPDTLRIYPVFYRGTSFRSFRGSYNALISDGKTGIIKNRDLFGEIQEIYDERHRRLDSIYESIKAREQYIITQYPFEKRDWGYTELRKARDQKIFLDIANFTEMKFFYVRDLIELRDKIQDTISLIEN